MSTAVDFYLECLVELEGVPYVYGAKGLPGQVGLDCSGTVSDALWDAHDNVDRRRNWNAQRYWTDLPHTETPLPGDFCLYGTEKRADHIMTLMPGGRVFGASGGDSTTTSVAEAHRIGAAVHYKPTVRYRKPDDFLGYVVNPLRANG